VWTAAGFEGNAAGVKSLLWMTPLFTTGGLRWTTTNRIVEFDVLYHEQLKAVGIDVVNILRPSQSMWEASSDGIHFFKPLFRTAVSSITAQVVFNHLFGAIKRQ
jgi:hypothetical protein